SGPYTIPPSGPPTGPRSGPHTSPRSGPLPRPRRVPPARTGTIVAVARTGTLQRARIRPGPRKSQPASVPLAIAVAVVLVLGAAGSLGYFVAHNFSGPTPAAQSQARSSANASSSPSPTLGKYGHIGSRKTDPQPLTLAQLFPARFTINTATVTLTAHALNAKCTAHIIGAQLILAVQQASCTQVARGTYLDASDRFMGTIGVLNLSTAAAAVTALHSTDKTDIIVPLPASTGPTHSIFKGVGAEQAIQKGHYLILMWAQYTTLKAPANSAQVRALQDFMDQMWKQTANVSLSQRFANGMPSSPAVTP
ncbi:MAG: hypothetical protein J2P28_26625, partial [Actinobacteria bacterium]|nr:hypothetical protein [Actinomycetota bacterium]